jgi:hypothetical protein
MSASHAWRNLAVTADRAGAPDLEKPDRVDRLSRPMDNRLRRSAVLSFVSVFSPWYATCVCETIVTAE